MNSIVDPLLAILAIVVPLGLAYVVIALQARNPQSVWLNVSANARNKFSPKGEPSSPAEEKYASR
jgi:hypothetical protein